MEAESNSPFNEREIDGVTYRTVPLGFAQGLPILKRLMDIAAPALAATLRAGDGGKAATAAEKKRQLAAMGAGLMAVLPSTLQTEDLTTFAKAFGAQSSYLNDDAKWCSLAKDADRNLHFTQRYMPFLRWLIFCVEVNFASFFSGIMAEVNARTAAAETTEGGSEVQAPSPSSIPGSTSSGES
jgi:hypothetical protein